MTEEVWCTYQHKHDTFCCFYLNRGSVAHPTFFQWVSEVISPMSKEAGTLQADHWTPSSSWSSESVGLYRRSAIRMHGVVRYNSQKNLTRCSYIRCYWKLFLKRLAGVKDEKKLSLLQEKCHFYLTLLYRLLVYVCECINVYVCVCARAGVRERGNWKIKYFHKPRNIFVSKRNFKTIQPLVTFLRNWRGFMAVIL